jgi:hypothetical protein
MKTLLDCNIVEYYLGDDADRHLIFNEASDRLIKPVYALPVFELCRSLHLLVKYHNISPSDFRSCWSNFSQEHLEQGEFFVHISEFSMNNPILDIINLRYRKTDDKTPLGEDPQIYWDHHKHLVQRLRLLHPVEDLKNGWMAQPPDGKATPPHVQDFSDRSDLVIDTNNFLELLNQLPIEGMGLDCQKLHFPPRLADSAVRKFKVIIETYGIAGHLIVPYCVLEEAEWVANLAEKKEKYHAALGVLETMKFDQNRPLWNIFHFETINQEIFDHFMFLYENLYVPTVPNQQWQDFSDLLVLSFGLYHGCKIASNEWFEGDKDVWDVVRTIYPYLVLE